MATETATSRLAEDRATTQSAGYTERVFSPEYLAEQEALEKRILEEGAKRIHRSCERLEAMGIIDKNGKRLKKELPADMLPGADRDFGG
jgi:hypothetical protein